MIGSIQSNEICEDENEFTELKKIIKRKIGFNCESYKQTHLKRRLALRLRITRSRSYNEYSGLLLKNPEELTQLKEALTVNVTELFRNPEMYEFVRMNVLPELIKTKGDNRMLKIWSAGCSNGEEASSIAIILREFLGISYKKYNISILCTDIDDDCLLKAEKLAFDQKQIEKLSKERLDRFFVKDGIGYILDDELRKIFKIKHHDMISGPKLGGFDLIFCRNVTIYFEHKLQEILYQDFYNALNEGGYFVMGKTESLVGPAGHMFKTVDLRERIYMKKGGS
ncbi:MAG: protein-glutamate O-methyltransferase CheR [Candidatus Methanoperedens sp.]|nr:protein-glutamate O-methyltransferase CheR [Candidatus Methanoperedens sp.]